MLLILRICFRFKQQHLIRFLLGMMLLEEREQEQVSTRCGIVRMRIAVAKRVCLFAARAHNFSRPSFTSSLPGKTLAFALPVIERLLNDLKTVSLPHGRAPRVLVLTPTRELAMQIQKTFDTIKGSKLQTTCVYGGTAYYLQ